MKYFCKFLISITALTIISASAQAMPVFTTSAGPIASNLNSSSSIDFRSNAWSGAYGTTNYTVNGVTTDTYSSSSSSKIFYDNVDGLGILGGENDEIDNINKDEQLKVSFSAGRSLGGIWITDLFAAPDGGSGGENGRFELTLANGDLYNFIFNGTQSDQNNGELYIDFGGQFNIAQVIFDTDANWIGSEFSVAGFTSVPEPGSLALMALGLAGFAFSRKGINR